MNKETNDNYHNREIKRKTLLWKRLPAIQRNGEKGHELKEEIKVHLQKLSNDQHRKQVNRVE